MKKLPNKWLIYITGSINPLLPKFKKWFNEFDSTDYSFCFKYYGMNERGTFCTDNSCYQLITLEEWNDCVFGKEETFEKGEEVLVRDKRWTDINEWVSAIFIAEYRDRYIVECAGLNSFDQCKKKPSELDVKIEELKKFAKEKGKKLTVIVE